MPELTVGEIFAEGVREMLKSILAQVSHHEVPLPICSYGNKDGNAQAEEEGPEKRCVGLSTLLK